MPAASETLPALEQRLTKRLLAFERLDEAWPRGRTAIERVEIGRHREDALSEIATLRSRIVTARGETLADAAAQLWRLMVMADEDPRPLVLLDTPDMRGLLASVLAVVEREAGHEAAQDVTFRNLLDTQKPWREAPRGGEIVETAEVVREGDHLYLLARVSAATLDSLATFETGREDMEEDDELVNEDGTDGSALEWQAEPGGFVARSAYLGERQERHRATYDVTKDRDELRKIKRQVNALAVKKRPRMTSPR